MACVDTEYYDPKYHQYTEHSGYTGPGCVICGRDRSQHETNEPQDTPSNPAGDQPLR